MVSTHDVPGGGGVQGGAPLSEHLGVTSQQDPGQQPHQRHVADDQEHLGGDRGYYCQ